MSRPRPSRWTARSSTVAYADVKKALVQVEFNRRSKTEPDDDLADDDEAEDA